MFAFIAASFSYDEDGRQRTKAAIPPPVFEDADRPRSPPGPANSFLANMGYDLFQMTGLTSEE